VQNQYNALQRVQVSRKDGELSLDDEREFLEFIGEKEIGLVPYLPLAVGLLTGRYRRGSLDQDGRLSEQAGEWFRNEVLTDRNLDLVERLIEIAERKGCSLAQLSIAWLLSRPVVCSVIAGVTRMEHLEDNAAACSVSLSHQEVEEIDHLTGST
jgi:aryl-alcohol dehydrogenase-like predicted oxidoreductase